MKKAFALFFSLFFLSCFAFAQNKPIVQDIQAQVGTGTKINVFWTLPENPKPAINKLLLYRSTRPITSISQIKKMLPLAELSNQTTGYTDNVDDFNDYYYCVISYTDKIYDLILISVNTTVNGVHLNPVVVKPKKAEKIEKEKLYAEDEMRDTPLPFIDYVEGLNKEQQISSDTAASASQFYSKKNNESQIVSSYFFEEDLISPDGGDDFLLFEILKTTFVQEKYEEAVNELRKLTNRNINRTVQNRAYFYMGEAQYFLGEYDEAVRSFLLVTKDFPYETKKWINLSLDAMTIPR